MVEEETEKVVASGHGFGVRHGLVILQFFSYVIIFGIEFSLSATISEMMNAFPHWTGSMVSEALSSYLYGFLVTLLFGGWVCKKYGFKWPMVILMVIISAVTLNLSSITKEYGIHGLITCRVIQGLCAGLMFSMPADFINRWIPIQERTILGTAIYASGLFGEFLGIMLSQQFSDTRLGWPFIFTQYGYLAIIWAILMAVFGANSPEEYTRNISEDELNYIVQNRGNVNPKAKAKIPWKQIFTSMPFWAIIVAQMGASWMLFVLSQNIPMYLHENYNMRERYVVFTFITLLSWILSFGFSIIAEHFISKGATTIGQSRKIFNTIGCLVPALFVIWLLVLPDGDDIEGIILFAIASVASVGTICGSKLNCNDITSNFAPIIFSFATWIGCIFNILMIMLFRDIIFDNWAVLFIVTAVLLFLTNAFFMKFASGKEQEWDLYEDISDEIIDLSKSSSYVTKDESKYLLYVRKE